MSFITPLAFIAGLLAIPIILLYMLRLRRREVTVSSTFLWQQVLQDREANTPWQKLRRNLLLFLQLLILALLIFALARPFIIVPAVSVGQTVILLDASASMNATDSPAGTRFEEAKRRALEIVDTMSPNDRMSVIRVAGAPEVLTPYTGDASLLRQAINAAQPSNARADWHSALTLAAGSGGTNEFNVVIIGDGGLGEAANLPAISGTVQYIPVGTSGDNLAITALSTRSLGIGDPQLFAQVTNYGTTDAEVVFTLREDGRMFSSSLPVIIPTGENYTFIPENLPQNFSVIEASLTIPSDSNYVDYLALDNTAWAVSAPTTARRTLLMSEGNVFLEQVLRALPTVNLFIGDINRGLPTESYDIYIFDGWVPPVLPDGDSLIINPPASTGDFIVGAETTATQNIRVNASDPRMNAVDFSNVNIRAFKPVLASWADTLIRAEGGALLLAGEIEGREVAILTFALADSDLPLQIAFPILISSLLDGFTPPDSLSGISTDGLRVEQSLTVSLTGNANNARVIAPNGEIIPMIDGDSIRIFTGADSTGLYTLEFLAGETVTQSFPFAVNAFDALESRIIPHETLTLGGQVISQAVEEQVGQQEFWSWLALAALIVLMIEWYAYHQRLSVPTIFKPLRSRA